MGGLPWRDQADCEAAPSLHKTTTIMNDLLEICSDRSKAVDLCNDDFAVVRKANGSPAHKGRSWTRWLKATVQPIDSRRDELERTHWKKVWRSMVEE
jgi:hypothetical protein